MVVETEVNKFKTLAFPELEDRIIIWRISQAKTVSVLNLMDICLNKSQTDKMCPLQLQKFYLVFGLKARRGPISAQANVAQSQAVCNKVLD